MLGNPVRSKEKRGGENGQASTNGTDNKSAGIVNLFYIEGPASRCGSADYRFKQGTRTSARQEKIVEATFDTVSPSRGRLRGDD